MWNFDYVNDLIVTKQQQVHDKEDFIREADFNRDLTECVKSRALLLEHITKLEEIRDGISKCLSIDDTNDYIAQKASVYTLIQAYKTLVEVAKAWVGVSLLLK